MTSSLATVTPIATEAKAAPNSGIRKGQGKIIGEQPMYLQMQRIGGSLTPAAVSQIFRDADLGNMARLMDLANEARQKDCHLQGVLETRENAVAALPWEMELPPKPTKVERKAAALCEEVLRPLMSVLVPHHNGAVYKGYAVSEIEWRKEGKYLVPVAATPKRERRFRYVGERLVWWDQDMAAGVDFRAEYPGRFVVSEPRVNGDTRCREGLVRPLMWAALFKNWATSDWLKLAEIAWKPWRTGLYEKNASDEDIDALIAVLDDMTSSGVAVLPETVKLEIHYPSGGTSAGNAGTHPALLARMDAEMSKAALGQTLTTEQGNKGTQALGTVHEGVKKDRRDGDAKYIDNDLGRDVCAWVTLLNFGPTVRPSKPKHATDDAVDLLSYAQGTKTLVDAGLRIPASHVRDQAGIPEPKDGEEVLEAAPKPDPNAGDGEQPKTENKPDGSQEEAPPEAA
jgi:phage gp29-like protein